MYNFNPRELGLVLNYPNVDNSCPTQHNFDFFTDTEKRNEEEEHNKDDKCIRCGKPTKISAVRATIVSPMGEYQIWHLHCREEGFKEIQK